MNNRNKRNISPETASDIERIYQKWDEAWSSNDLEAMIALYAPDATLESPLIPHLLGTDTGICRGRDQISELLKKAAPRKPVKRSFHRSGYFTDGKMLVWEYPRETPTDDQMDFFEVMEIEDGLIQKHRVYWGWQGVEVLKADSYNRDT